MPVKRKSTNSKPQITNEQKEAAEAAVVARQNQLNEQQAQGKFYVMKPTVTET